MHRIFKCYQHRLFKRAVTIYWIGKTKAIASTYKFRNEAEAYLVCAKIKEFKRIEQQRKDDELNRAEPDIDICLVDSKRRVEIGPYIYFDEERFYQGQDNKIIVNITENMRFRSFFHEVVNRSRLLMERYRDDIGEEYLDRAGEEIRRIYRTLQRSGSSDERALVETFEEVYAKMEKDHNSHIALWIVIGYFFDLCDIGRKPDGDG